VVKREILVRNGDKCFFWLAHVSFFVLHSFCI
jgi:hypothetical protein